MTNKIATDIFGGFILWALFLMAVHFMPDGPSCKPATITNLTLGFISVGLCLVGCVSVFSWLRRNVLTDE